MEPDVREAIAQRALSAGASASHSAGDQILFGGSVLIASGPNAAALIHNDTRERHPRL
jgi:hypothetical protein